MTTSRCQPFFGDVNYANPSFYQCNRYFGPDQFGFILGSVLFIKATFSPNIWMKFLVALLIHPPLVNIIGMNSDPSTLLILSL